MYAYMYKVSVRAPKQLLHLCVVEVDCVSFLLDMFPQTLLSHRYGYRPLRAKIPEAEMTLFIDELKQRSQEDLDFLLKWYQRDENAVPPVYILKVRQCTL